MALLLLNTKKELASGRRWAEEWNGSNHRTGKTQGWGKRGTWDYAIACNTACGTQDILLQHQVREHTKWGQPADICLGREPNGLDTAADSNWLIYSTNKRNTYLLEELRSRFCSDFKQIGPKGPGLKENKNMPNAQQAVVVQKLSFEGAAGLGPPHRIAVDINSKYTSSWKQGE